MAQGNKTPAWVWIGCGCLLMVVILVVAIGAMGVAGFSFLKGMADDMADPLARTEAAMQLLGAEQLPEGYQAVAFFKIPWIMEMVVLSDTDAPPMEIEGDWEEKMEALDQVAMHTQDLGPNTFFYLELRGESDGAPFEDLVSGERRHGNSHVEVGVELDSLERLGEGQFDIGDQGIAWWSHRGVLDGEDGTVEGLYAVFSITCPDSSYRRDAFWFQRAAGAEGSGSAEAIASEAAARQSASLEDTPADPAAMERLLGHFRVCN